MEEFECSRLPVVANGYYTGFVAEEMIRNHEAEEINDFQLLGENGEIDQGSHYYDVIKCALEFDLPLISIKDHQGVYLGAVLTAAAFEMFATNSALRTPGGVIVLSLNYRDYSLKISVESLKMAMLKSSTVSWQRIQKITGKYGLPLS